MDRNDRFDPLPLSCTSLLHYFKISSEIPTLSFSLEKVIKKIIHLGGFFPYRPLMENSPDISMERPCMMISSNNGQPRLLRTPT